ncbi:hypothetical protein PI125_g13468 [Phytophthora idaei]|nr:hypothetical protein PI125_g13468 [Phytophthora idaei]
MESHFQILVSTTSAVTGETVFMDSYANVGADVYCTPECCTLEAHCSDVLRPRQTLKLSDTNRVGLGVYTTVTMDIGDTVGEYAGELSESAAMVAGQPAQAMKQHSGYTLLYNDMSEKKKYVYVEAPNSGSVTRFNSHACDPNAAFMELQNHTSLKTLDDQGCEWSGHR